MAARSAKEYETAVRSLAPYPPLAADGRPDVLVERLAQPLADPVQERLGDAGDGLHTAWDGRGLRLMHDAAGCRLLFATATADARIELEPGFPWWRSWSEVTRPLLGIPLAAAGAAVVHASAVEHDGRGIAIGGWAESGKTEVALALCEQGARFVSDKWTALAAGGTLHAMPVPAGLRAWTVPHLPQLRGELGVQRRARAAGGRTLAATVERFGGRGGGGPALAAARGAARRAASLAGRISLSSADLGAAPDGGGTGCELSVLVVLRAVDGPPQVCALDPRAAARRLLVTTGYERRMLDALDARARYSGGEGIPGFADLPGREAEILEQALSRCRVVELAAPFPADPRPAAEALLSFLRDA